MAYFGRIFNAAVALVLIYFSIKIIPFGKKIIALTALLPIAIEGLTSLSPDAITISSSLFLISYVLSICFNKTKEKIEKKDFIILLITSIVVSLCKIVYLPLIFLVLLIPKEKFENTKQRLIFTLVIMGLGIVVNLVWLGISSTYLSIYDSSSGQVLSVLSNPFNYILMVMYTLMQNFGAYTLGMVGIELGWCEIVKVLPFVAYAFVALLVIATLSTNNKKLVITKKYYIIFAIVSLIIIGLILTSLYVQWTQPGSNIIVGVQGRYFLPILPVMLLLARPFVNKNKVGFSVEKFILVAAIVLNFSAILSIVLEFI